MRYFLHIGFDGSKYHGWQRQPNVNSVQEEMEESLQRIFKRHIVTHGCGRTDSGVHASQFFAHIDLEEPLTFDLKFRLNKNLSPNIAIYDVIEVTNQQHSRYDANFRTYDYFIHLYKDPILSPYSAYYDETNLDFEAMQQATDLLLGRHDFSAFCKHPKHYKHTYCTVKAAALYINKQQNRIRLCITADRFLQGMIRITIHFLLQVGKKKLSVQAIAELLANQRKKPILKKAAQANGLYLSGVHYPELSVQAQPSLCEFLKDGLID